jgi:hypothetical protein
MPTLPNGSTTNKRGFSPALATSCIIGMAQGAVFHPTLASMARFGGVTDFLPSPFFRVREQCPVASFFMSQTLMPESYQSHFHVNIPKTG